jgi:hypothetical protein
MNDIDLITPETDNDFQEIQEREHVRPAPVFKGQELLPFSRGSRILYGMVLNDNDLVIYRVLAFIFIHMHPRTEIIPLVWGDVNKFREKVLEFRETLTDEDETEAQRIVNEVLEADAATKVMAEPEHSGDGKKNDDVT